MYRKDLADVYKCPEWHQPPIDVKDMRTCTQYPNINSIEYRNLPVSDETQLYPFYEWLAANDTQSTMVLATNSYTGRNWNGTLWGYEKFTDIGHKTKEVFKLKVHASTTALRFIESNLLIVTNASGAVQLWSTQSDLRQKDGYSMFCVAKKTDHIGLILSMDMMQDNRRLLMVTGATDQSIRLWNIGPLELTVERIYRTAHVDSVTGIACKSDGTLFCSCSRDKSFSIWDYRQSKPVIDYHENHSVAYTTCKWIDNRLFIGDESGNLFVYDIRKGYDEPLRMLKIFDRPIRRLRSDDSASLMAVFGDTSRMRMLNLQNGSDAVYDFDSNDDYLRDLCWCRNTDSKRFYTIGYNSHVKEHCLNKNE